MFLPLEEIPQHIQPLENTVQDADSRRNRSERLEPSVVKEERKVLKPKECFIGRNSNSPPRSLDGDRCSYAPSSDHNEHQTSRAQPKYPICA